MIAELRLRGFKGVGAKPRRIRIRPFTLLFGGNSCGKTTFLEALLVLGQSWESGNPGRLVLEGERAHLGSFHNALHRPGCSDIEFSLDVETMGAPTRRLVLRYEGDRRPDDGPSLFGQLEEIELRDAADDQGDPVRCVLLQRVPSHLSIADDDEDTKTRHCEILFPSGGAESMDDSWLGVTQDEDTWLRLRLSKVEGVKAGVQLRKLAAAPDVNLFVGISGDGTCHIAARWSKEREKTVRLAADELRSLMQVRWDRVFPLLRAGTYHMGAVRVAGVRHEPPEAVPEEVGAHGERLTQLLHAFPSVRERLNHLLEGMGIPYRFDVEEIRGSYGVPVLELRLEDARKGSGGLRVGLPDVGYGISQVVPVLAQAALMAHRFEEHEGENLLLLEHPEIHLHPRLQAELGEALARVAGLLVPEGEETDERQQPRFRILAETHSEHMLLRLMRLVRAGQLRPEDVAVNVFDVDDEGRSRGVWEVEITPEGEFADPWPGGFFPERYRERLGEE